MKLSSIAVEVITMKAIS